MIKYKKILLVNPPHVEQGGYTPSPLGILYLAAYLRLDKKLKIKIVDASVEGEKKLITVLKNFRPNLVGISSLTPGRHEAFKVALTAKKINPQCKIVLGGIHPTLMWKQIMENYPQIDFIVKGEGEITLWDLVHEKNLKKIKGLIWKNKNIIVKNPDQPLISNLNKLPFPAWDMIDPKIYPAWGKGIYNNVDTGKEIRYPLIFSRGCMGACTFCSSWMVWKGYRCRSGLKVADEVEYLYKRYGARHFVFQDDTLTGNHKEMIIFCKEILKRKVKIAIFGTTRVDQVNIKILKWMKKAGFYELSYGIESGSPALLLKINKRTNMKQNYIAAQITKKSGIRFTALMMSGLPGETVKDRQLSIKFLKKINPKHTGSLGETWIFPGTALYEQAKHARLINDSFWLGKKPYYIYRGGIGKDAIKWPLQIKDEIMFAFRGTILEKPLETFFIRLTRLPDKFKRIYKN